MGSAFATPQLGGTGGVGLRQMPSGAAAAAAGHRRIQSQAIMGQFGGNAFGMPGSIGGYGMPGMGLPGIDHASALGLGLPAAGARAQHGRRHSVNVLNKSTGPLGGDMGGSPSFIPNNLDGFDDGFAAPGGAGGHSRQASRADPSWRNGECIFNLSCDYFIRC